jgi:Cu/Ag efflux pump CusA
VWLEMRVNIGHAIPVSLAISIYSFVLRRRPFRLVSFLLVEALAVLLVFVLYGFSLSAALIVPAALFRDGFHLGFMSLQRINLFLLCSLGTVNVGWIGADAIMRIRNGKIQRSANGQTSLQDRKYVLEMSAHG